MLKYFILVCLIVANLGIKAQHFMDKGVYFALRPGIAYEYATPRGYLIDHLHFNKPRQQQFSVLMDWDADGFKGFMIRGEVSYKSMAFYGQGFAHKGRFDTYDVSGFTIVPEVACLYGTHRQRSLRIVGGIGLGLVASTVRRNDYTIFYEGMQPIADNKHFDAQGGDFIATFNACLMYKRRLELNLKYWPFTWYDGTQNENRFNSRSISFAVCFWL